jgi:hypothetical protein
VNPIIEQIISQDPSGYQELPEVLKGIYSEREWQFLTDRQKADLIQAETEPEA